MANNETTLSQDLLWKQYQMYIDLYKHYLDLIIKFNIFYYVVTGGIISFYFSKLEIPLIKYSLLFPLLMSVGFSIIFIYGASMMGVIREDIFNIRDELGLETAPELNVLTFVLVVSAILFMIVAIGLGYLIFCWNGNPIT